MLAVVITVLGVLVAIVDVVHVVTVLHCFVTAVLAVSVLFLSVVLFAGHVRSSVSGVFWSAVPAQSMLGTRKVFSSMSERIFNHVQHMLIRD